MAEKWRTEKVKRPRVVVEQWVDALKLHFGAEVAAGNALAVETGGSWRRGADPVGDIDIIVQTADGTIGESLFGGVRLPDWIRWDRRADKVAQGSIILSDGSELHVDVWGVAPKELGAFLWFATGPKELNIEMRKLALRKGMNLSQIGLLRDGVQVDDGTEKGVALALGWPWMEPVERQAWVGGRPATSMKVERKVAGSKGAVYDVACDAGGWTCTCPHFYHRRVECKHVKQVRAEVDVALAAPVPLPDDPFEGLL